MIDLNGVEKTEKIQKLEIEKQIDKLKEKDLIIRNEKSVVKILNRIGYHRLSGYFQFFIEKSTGDFHNHTTFEDIEKLYRFDSDLRLIYLELMQEIEISLKSYLAEFITNSYGAYGWDKEILFIGSNQTEKESKRAKTNSLKWITMVKEKIHHFERDRANERYKVLYNGNYPIEMITEMLDFGNISKLFKNLKPEDKQEIAKYYNNEIPYQYLENWFEQFVSLRNICSHHARIVGKNFQIKKSRELRKVRANNLFALTLAAEMILADRREWKVFQAKLVLHLENNSEYAELLGFPNDWNI